MFDTFGLIHAARKEWQAAITNFSKEVQVSPTNHLAYHFLAPLLVQVEDLDGYARLRSAILKRFADTTDPVAAERMAKACLILPAPATELQTIGKMADTALASDPGHPFRPYFEFAKGFSEYRLRHFESAAEQLEKVAAKFGVQEGN